MTAPAFPGSLATAVPPAAALVQYAARADLLCDPRSDLAADSLLWRELLTDAWAPGVDHPASCFGVLLGLRCVGCRLLPGDRGGLRLTHGELDADAYASFRAVYLLPKAGELTRLLRGGAR